MKGRTNMLHLYIEAENMTELRAKVAAALGDTTPTYDTSPTAIGDFPGSAGYPTTVKPAITLPSAPAEKQSRRGRPPKNKDVAAPAVEQPADPLPVAHEPQASAQTDTAASVETAQPSMEPAASADAAPAVNPFDDAPAAPTHTIDDCRVALQAVNGKHGLQGCMSLLKEFGVDRVSLVKPEDFARFIAACHSKAAQ
jgi:hypothetical protein